MEASVRVLKRGREAVCRSNTPGSSEKSGRSMPSLKMSWACSPAALRSSCRTWPRSGMMRNGRCCRQPPLAPLTTGKGRLLLPIPTVITLTQSLGFYLRSRECWERATNLSAYLLGLGYGLTGRTEKPSGKHIVDPSFVEWMMGVPKDWTRPDGPSLLTME